MIRNKNKRATILNSLFHALFQIISANLTHLSLSGAVDSAGDGAL